MDPAIRFLLLVVCVASINASASPMAFTADLVKRADGSALHPGDKPDGFKVAPTIGENNGTRVIAGPGTWETPATPGIVSIRLSMLGFESGHQHDLITIQSDAGKPYGVIRNINSSDIFVI